MLIPAFGGNTSGPAIAVTKPYQASRVSNGIVGHNGIKSSSIGNSRFAKQMSQDGSQNDCKRRIGSLETKTNSRNAGISGLISHYFGSHAERRKAWPGRQVRTVKFRTPALTSDVWLCFEGDGFKMARLSANRRRKLRSPAPIKSIRGGRAKFSEAKSIRGIFRGSSCGLLKFGG